MKSYACFLIVMLLGSLLPAADFESYRFVDRLLSISEPGEPIIFEDAVIFTAPSTSRKVGIAFEHEGFSQVHWFRRLMKSGTEAEAFHDSGILFHIHEIPLDLHEMEYRLVMDGLWTHDPGNPLFRVDARSGLIHSYVELPSLTKTLSSFDGPPGTLRFSYETEPGQIITVAGSFNAWDPFMYELHEERPGQYLLTLPLPSGIHRYVFIHKGERILDPNNPRKVYTRDGKIASEAVIQ